MAQWQYKHIRLDYKGRGITQEINLFDLDCERIRGWESGKEAPTLPEMFEALGKDGWELTGFLHAQPRVFVVFKRL